MESPRVVLAGSLSYRCGQGRKTMCDTLPTSERGFARTLKIIDQGEAIRQGWLDEITFVIFFYPWVALWVPYEPINAHTMQALQRLQDAPEIMLWPALLILARIWDVAVDAIPKTLWKR